MHKFGFFAVSTSTVVSLALSGCVVVVPITIFLQNFTNQPVQARLHYHDSVRLDEIGRYGYQAVFAKGLRYSPKIPKPSRRAVRQLRDTLPVSATDTASTFTIPPHATVLLINAYGHHRFELPKDAKLYLQLGATTQVLDAESFLQAAHFRRGTFYYAIGRPTL